jgi:hypothetical protein
MTVKILGQSAPSATTETDLYETPASTETVISSLVVCNRDVNDSSFRVSISAGGGATANEDYIYYDVPIPANDTFIATVGFTMESGDVIRVYAADAVLSFSLFGQESSV